MIAMGEDPEQALPAHRTEVQPPEMGIAPINNDNLATIQQRDADDMHHAGGA